MRLITLSGLRSALAKMGRKVLKLSLTEVVVGDKIYSEFPDGVGLPKKGYMPVITRLDLGAGGIHLGIEYDSAKEPTFIKVEEKMACVVREFL
jgi:hypothetical protein